MSRRQRAVVCQQLVEMVNDYLEGDLDLADRSAVEAHLAQCAHCTGYVEQVRRMLELTIEPDVGTASVPSDMLEVLTGRYRDRH